MNAIRVLRGCGASGVSLAKGTVYAVPGEVSEKDATILVRLGKAEYVEPEQPEGDEGEQQPEQPEGEETPTKRGKKADA